MMIADKNSAVQAPPLFFLDGGISSYHRIAGNVCGNNILRFTEKKTSLQFNIDGAH